MTQVQNSGMEDSLDANFWPVNAIKHRKFHSKRTLKYVRKGQVLGKEKQCPSSIS